MSAPALRPKSPTSLTERRQASHLIAPANSQTCIQKGGSALSGGPRPLRDLRHAVLEPVEERVLGGAGQPALVGALEEHGGLPQRQRRVPAQVGHRTPGALF